MQDDYSGLSRAYTTAPVRAVRDLTYRLEDIYATVDTVKDALKYHQSCETESTEIVLTRLSSELHILYQEVKHLEKDLDGGADNEQ